MRFAIYDKAADGYLTKMAFDLGYSNRTQFECALTEYITDAKLLDTKESANLAITNIEQFKFMEKGRFVVHSFDEKLAGQYIISEAGNPTKVVDSITVDLDGNINVKYGTMLTHWSATSLEYAINRMNALQKAKSPKYAAWCNTFDIYKVITVIDERECTHYQFIKVTGKGLKEFAKDEEKNLVVGKEITDITDPLNKRIEELEAKVESIKKEAHHWKKKYESSSADNTFPCMAVEARELLKDVTDIARAKKLANAIIDIWEADDKFEITLKKFSQLYEGVNNPSDDDDTIMHAFKGVLEILSSLEDHVRNIIDDGVYWKNRAKKAEKAMDDHKKLNENFNATIVRYRNEMTEMRKKVSNAADWLEEVNNKNEKLTNMLNEITDCVADIMGATRNVDRNKMASELIDIARKIGFKTRDDGPMFGILVILNILIREVKESNNLAISAKEFKELFSIRNSLAEVIFAVRNAIYNNDGAAFDCIESRMIHDSDFNSDPFMAGARENIKDICAAEKRNLENNDLKNGIIARLTKERDTAINLKEMYKRQANSIYGMTMPCRCNGKQMLRDMLYEVTTGIKIPVDKEKYDDLVEYVNTINTTYDILKCADFTKDKPIWFDVVITRIKNLTE